MCCETTSVHCSQINNIYTETIFNYNAFEVYSTSFKNTYTNQFSFLFRAAHSMLSLMKILLFVSLMSACDVSLYAEVTLTHTYYLWGLLLIRGQDYTSQVHCMLYRVIFMCIFGQLHYEGDLSYFAWHADNLKRQGFSRGKTQRFVMGVTMALLECPPPWNSMVPKASVGLSCVCLLIDHFSDKLSFLANRSALSF